MRIIARFAPFVTLTLRVLGIVAYPAIALVPKGYRQVKITDDPTTFDYFPRINNHGQIVFTRRDSGDGDDRSDEIFLYDDGELIQITNDRKKDYIPNINDDGTIVWSRGIGPESEYGPTLEIMMRTPDGVITRLTDDVMTIGNGSLVSCGLNKCSGTKITETGKIKVSAGLLEILAANLNGATSPPTSPDWELSGGTIQVGNDFGTGCVCDATPIQIELTGGTLNFKANFTTTHSFDASGGTLIKKADKTVTLR